MRKAQGLSLFHFIVQTTNGYIDVNTFLVSRVFKPTFILKTVSVV